MADVQKFVNSLESEYQARIRELEQENREYRKRIEALDGLLSNATTHLRRALEYLDVMMVERRDGQGR